MAGLIPNDTLPGASTHQATAIAAKEKQRFSGGKT
jgi:hypothetical protein